MTSIRGMRVLLPPGPEADAWRDLGCPEVLPWQLFETDRARRTCLDNHGQVVERVNACGGLDPVEALAVVEGRTWFSLVRLPRSVVVERLREHVQRCEESHEV